MKKVLYFIILIPSFVYSQSVQNNLEADICKCFNKNEVSFIETQNLDLFDTCFSESFEIHKVAIEKEALKYIDTTDQSSAYIQGQKYGRKIFTDIQSGLISECDSYYKVMSLTSKMMFENFKKGATAKKVDSISTLISANANDLELVLNRGLYHFGLKNVGKARLDFETYLENDPKNSTALTLLAFTYQREDDNKKAIEYYNLAINSGEGNETLIDIAKINLAILLRKEEE